MYLYKGMFTKYNYNQPHMNSFVLRHTCFTTISGISLHFIWFCYVVGKSNSIPNVQGTYAKSEQNLRRTFQRLVTDLTQTLHI